LQGAEVVGFSFITWLLFDASPSGGDVFFTALSSLLPQDYGLVDLYDARAGGGFPNPPPPLACVGDACQSPPAPPDYPTPASSTFEGAGNVVEVAVRKCPKGKVKRRGKCVKKEQGRLPRQRPYRHRLHQGAVRRRSLPGGFDLRSR
jgi:hypothetical protein